MGTPPPLAERDTRNALKRVLVAAASALCPDLMLTVRSIRSRRLIEQQCRGFGLDTLARTTAAATGGIVQAGPFAGMRIDYDALPVHAAPMYRGTYERELHDAVVAAIGRSPTSVLNIGAAEGYYAVGFARRLPDIPVFAADSDPKARRAAALNASLNGVGDRVHALGIVHAGKLGRYLRGPRPLLVMDCEGAEFGLIDVGADPALAKTDMIVELHARAGDVPGLIGALRRTHVVSVMSAQPRQHAAEDEWRSVDNSWLWAAAHDRR